MHTITAKGAIVKICCRILLCLFLPVVSYVAPCVRMTASDATGLQPYQEPLALLVNGHSSCLARC
jgi:hypothetical protein